MHELKPLSLARVDPFEVDLEQLEDPSFIPKPSQLTIDEEPGFYLYEMNLFNNAGLPCRLRGIVGKLEIHSTSDALDHLQYSEAEGEPHASIRPRNDEPDDPFNDRRDASGPLWLLIDEERIAGLLNLEGQLVARVTDSMGVHHRMYHIYQAGAIALIENAISHQTMTIADGHRRFRRAIDGLSATKQRSRNNHSETIAFISTIETAEQCIRPLHRCYHLDEGLDDLLNQLTHHFRVTELSLASIDPTSDVPLAPTIVVSNRAYQIESVRSQDGVETSIDTPAWIAGNADAEILSPLLQNLTFHIDYQLKASEVLHKVDSEANTLGLLCRGVSIERFRSALADRHLLPPQSILFSPKPLPALMLQESKT